MKDMKRALKDVIDSGLFNGIAHYLPEVTCYIYIFFNLLLDSAYLST